MPAGFGVRCMKACSQVGGRLTVRIFAVTPSLGNLLSQQGASLGADGQQETVKGEGPHFGI